MTKLPSITNPTSRRKRKIKKPCVCIGWTTIALLAQGKTVILNDVILIPDSLLFDTAAEINRGGFKEITSS